MPPRSRGRAERDPGAQALSEADALKQRGERRKGLEAVTCLQQAVDLYQRALSHGLAADDVSEARFGLAWCLQLCGDAMREATHTLPDEMGSWQAEREAKGAAVGMYRQAVAAYQQVLGDSGRMREDAATNCGNTLCSLAETLVEASTTTVSSAPLATPSPTAAAASREAASCYSQARSCYQQVLQQEPEDAAGWSNLADCLMAYAQLLAEPQLNQVADAEAACSEGLAAYERSCSECDSSQGDDLPGLLCNWGSGLLAAAQMHQDLSSRRSLLDQAASRLQHAASFAMADPEPLVRLGDALVAAAELEQQVQQGGGLQAAAALFLRALKEGYEAALSINRGNSEALVGCAEAHTHLAKVATGMGDAALAESHWSSSVGAYEAALQHPAQLGAFSERCGVRFNLACTLALAGREQQAQGVLAGLLGCGGVSAADLASDADLAGVRDKPWFQQLLAAVQQQQAEQGSA